MCGNIQEIKWAGSVFINETPPPWGAGGPNTLGRECVRDCGKWRWGKTVTPKMTSGNHEMN